MWRLEVPGLTRGAAQDPPKEAITLTVFVPFAILYMREPPKLDFLWSGLCLVGAVYFAFRT